MLVDVDASALVLQFIESIVFQVKGFKWQNLQVKVQAKLERLCGHEPGYGESNA